MPFSVLMSTISKINKYGVVQKRAIWVDNKLKKEAVHKPQVAPSGMKVVPSPHFPLPTSHFPLSSQTFG
jgi:hypothetical protein